MAIVSLGNFDIFVGETFKVYAPFAYRGNRAYAIYATFTSPNFSNVFSFIRIYPFIMPNNGTSRLVARPIDLEILDIPTLFLFPCSQLFDSNGAVSFYAERRSPYYGGGDGVLVNLELSYDDDLVTGTWL